MDVEELSKWTDEQVFAKTEQHLDSLHKSILESVLQRQNFHKIAGNNGYSYDHVKREGAKLWKLLSDVFSEEIEQKNVRSILENKAGSILCIVLILAMVGFFGLSIVAGMIVLASMLLISK